MAHDFYLLYDSATLMPLSISGSEFDKHQEGLVICKLQEHIAEDLINHKKSLHDYLVKLDGDYAELIFKNSDLWHRKKTMPDNAINDLSYRVTFFSCLDMTFNVTDKLRLYFDIDTVELEYRTNFLTTVNEQHNCAYIYVSEFNNPVSLLTRFEIDLLELQKNKIIELDYNNPNISVWASRK